MARTGLRMMPTSPSPPLKFRTVGFPQYGLKASLSGGAFPESSPLNLAPRIRGSTPGLPPPFAPLRDGHCPPRLCVRDGPHLGVPRFEGGSPLLPQGSLAPVRVLLSRSISAYYDPIRQSRGHLATSPLGGLYAMPSLCGSA